MGDERADLWKGLVAAVAAMLGLGIVAVVLLGAQTSSILSTVGASIGSVSGGAADPPAQEDEPGTRPADAAGGDSPGGDSPGGGSPGGGGVLLGAERPDLLVIKTASVTVQVAALDDAIRDATATFSGLGGYVRASKREGDGSDAYASLTFRLPADRWEDGLAAARTLGDRVVAEHAETREVTGEVADLGARIRNLETTERALQAIMDRAGGIKDVLTVQSELTTVRGEIERLVTQQQGLQEQAAYSTLDVTLVLRPDPVVSVQEGYDPNAEVEAAAATLVELGQAGLTVGIWLAIVWLPVLAVAGLLAAATFLAARRLRRSPGDQAAVGS